jgi:hypothetical protein
MRLAIFAACADSSDVLTDGRHFDVQLPRSFFETQGYAHPAPASQMREGRVAEVDWLCAGRSFPLFFLVNSPKCVLKSASQFDFLGVSRSSHLAKTASALANHGMGRRVLTHRAYTTNC